MMAFREHDAEQPLSVRERQAYSRYVPGELFTQDESRRLPALQERSYAALRGACVALQVRTSTDTIDLASWVRQYVLAVLQAQGLAVHGAEAAPLSLPNAS